MERTRMERTRRSGLLVACCGLVLWAWGRAGAVSIYELQYVSDPDVSDDSPYMNSIVASFDGGVVVHKFPGGSPKLTLYDPSHPTAWGGVQIKDWTASHEMYDAVSVGDWVSFTNVYVEEYRGNTMLQYDSLSHGSGFSVVSSGNPMPDPILVSLADIPAPVEDPGDPGSYYVEDHRAEKYEAMWLAIRYLIVTEMNLGKASDNYNVTGNSAAWVSDYMNDDRDGDYHPYVFLGQEFARVSGILEQYERLSNGWDYYQLLTTRTADLVLPEPNGIILLLTAGIMLSGARRRR